MTDNLQERLRLRDAALLAGFCLVLFGYALVGGRPLTLHEAVLPQSTREMLADHDWLVPKCGGRPWLERPPLPQWITAAVATLIGRCDREWIVRIAPALIGTGVVLAVAWMAAGWFGRSLGIASGLVLATMFEFTSYAWLAEQDIFLCGLVTAVIVSFVQLEFFQPEGAGREQSFFGRRSLLTSTFFFVLGMTNLAKGLGFGTVMALAPIGGYLLATGSWNRVRRYLWLWGWLVFAIVAAAWPAAVYGRYPDVLDLWKYDHFGRLNGAYTAINQPWWYYLATLPWQTAPWTLVAVMGAVVAFPKCIRKAGPERFLLLWATLPVLVYSIPSGKHHHYLLHCLAPWAVLSSLGLAWIWERIGHRRVPSTSPQAIALAVGVPGAALLWWIGNRLPGPSWLPWAGGGLWLLATSTVAVAISRRSASLTLAPVLGCIAAVYCWAHSCVIPGRDQCLEDTAFLRAVGQHRSSGVELYVNADLDTMDAFRILFYLDADAVAVHNLTYLLDERIRQPRVQVITRVKDAAKLEHLGNAELLLTSERTRRESSPADRLALFALEFREDLARGVSPPVSPMQAMDRADGPFVRKLW